MEIPMKKTGPCLIFICVATLVLERHKVNNNSQPNWPIYGSGSGSTWLLFGFSSIAGGGSSTSAISSRLTLACTTAHPILSPVTFILVRNLSKNQSTARISDTRSGGTPIAVITMINVTKPAWGIPAAPTLATVAVILKLSRYVLHKLFFVLKFWNILHQNVYIDFFLHKNVCLFYTDFFLHKNVCLFYTDFFLHKNVCFFTPIFFYTKIFAFFTPIFFYTKIFAFLQKIGVKNWCKKIGVKQLV